jgi:hypothetical protein
MSRCSHPPCREPEFCGWAAYCGATDILGEKPMHIKTSFVYPPIPIRNFDWSAVDASTYDGEGSPIGYGETEQEAIADLLQQIEERQ